MRKLGRYAAWAVACGLLVNGASAQVPGGFGAAGTAGAGGSTASTITAASNAAGQVPQAQPKNLFSFFCPTDEQCQKCKEKLCKIPLIQLAGNFLAPARALTGGMLPECCPKGPSAADLAKPADSAEGAAARIQAEEADAKARRAAVRYLATVDCAYFPEAEAALIASLRADTNECVRWEAAMGLNRGCCCTKKIVAALKITVEGTDKDKNPPEKSERVRHAALAALMNCLANQCNTDTAEPPEKPQRIEAPEKAAERVAIANTILPAYYRKLDMPMSELLEEARILVGRVPPPRTVQPSGLLAMAVSASSSSGTEPTTLGQAIQQRRATVANNSNEPAATLFEAITQALATPVASEPPLAAGTKLVPVPSAPPAARTIEPVAFGAGVPVSRSKPAQQIAVSP